MTDTVKLIDSIRKVYDEKSLTISKIEKLLAEKGKEGAIAHTTIGRFFSKEKRDIYNYRYDDTIRPLAEILLDVDTNEIDDDTETQAMKTFVRVKGKMIDELESEINVYERIEKEREQFARSIEFLKTQIERKDQRIDRLMASCEQKDTQILELTNKINDLIEQMKACPLRSEKEGD